MGEEDLRMIPIAQELLLAAAALGLLMLVCLIRVILGPTAPDRIVAADAINTLVTASLVLLGTAFNEIIYVDLAIVYAVLGFVSTLYIAKYLEGKA